MDGPSQAMPSRVSAGLFPLPNVVLLPGAILPLHIFELRYRRMTADALAGDSLIAMALLRPGWERDYYSRPAIEPVVCVGRIVAHERLGDGKYNLLLQGQWRARVVGESTVGELEERYRVADLAPVDQSPVMEIDLARERQQLKAIFNDASRPINRSGAQFAHLLSGPTPTATIADLIAFTCLGDVSLKQAILCDGDICHRVGQVVSALQQLQSARPAAPVDGNDMDGASLN
jgi:Lon protease-like protein